ncbi:hypothetical protein Acr_14g0002480 [Actinidia rufa]|uniref:Uncharacterized protein n=1 Tax=Actinidia rufa TaxID=165716 RepID=A0A7J0FPG2_9ERIC|nr:hypothetical protein Acr_14g0002480 [Actinidia rufa]
MGKLLSAVGAREGVEGGFGVEGRYGGRAGGGERWWGMWLWWLAVVIGVLGSLWVVVPGCGCKSNC